MGDVIIYQAEDGRTRLQVQLDQETVWLSQEQMAELFDRERSVITKHLRNVFREGELDENSVRAKFAHTAADGKTYQTQFYNLDVIISVGYRVKSQQGTRFRQWATGGNTVESRLGMSSPRQGMPGSMAMDGAVMRPETSLSLDSCRAVLPGTLRASANPWRNDGAEAALISTALATGGVRSRIANGYTVNEQRLWEESANLLYFIVKNHAFSDGNKRIAAALFIGFLGRNGILYRPDGGKRLADNALVALTLLIAESRPEEKDTLVKVVVNLINRNNDGWP